MPVRRRVNRRRASAGLTSWELYLETGHDYFGDLRDAGVWVDERGNPSRDDAVEAWLAFADQLIETWKVSRRHQDQDAWALREFGDPRAARRRARR